MNKQISSAQPWIIAALSLLLGLSIGQIQRQHRRIQELESSHFSIAIQPPPPPDIHYDIAAELRREREQMLLERDQMLDELNREIARVREEVRQ